jgi:ribosomal protein S18 acetylase RimI-like enzyme
LLDHVLSSAEGRAASSTLVFAPAAAPGLVTDLQSREFVVERYWHMERSLDGLRDEPEPGREWNARDAHPVAGLMARAYESGQPARPFAREGDAAAWLDYVRQLTTTTGCGVFAPKLSIVVEGRKRDTVAAAVVTTSVGPGTGHLAQVVVDPDAQGVGLGRRAVRSAMDKLRHAGFARVTLLVGEQNRTARGLYRTLGFVDTAEFVSAAVDQPRRLTSAALATGGVRTFL